MSMKSKRGKRKKSLVGWIETGNWDNLHRIYCDWHKVDGVTFVSKKKSIWYEPKKVRITLEEL